MSFHDCLSVMLLNIFQQLSEINSINLHVQLVGNWYIQSHKSKHHLLTCPNADILTWLPWVFLTNRSSILWDWSTIPWYIIASLMRIWYEKFTRQWQYLAYAYEALYIYIILLYPKKASWPSFTHTDMWHTTIFLAWTSSHFSLPLYPFNSPKVPWTTGGIPVSSTHACLRDRSERPGGAHSWAQWGRR